MYPEFSVPHHCTRVINFPSAADQQCNTMQPHSPQYCDTFTADSFLKELGCPPLPSDHDGFEYLVGGLSDAPAPSPSCYNNLDTQQFLELMPDLSESPFPTSNDVVLSPDNSFIASFESLTSTDLMIQHKICEYPFNNSTLQDPTSSPVNVLITNTDNQETGNDGSTLSTPRSLAWSPQKW